MVEDAKKMKKEAEKEMKEKGRMEMEWGGLEEGVEESRSKRRRR